MCISWCFGSCIRFGAEVLRSLLSRVSLSPIVEQPVASPLTQGGDARHPKGAEAVLPSVGKVKATKMYLIGGKYELRRVRTPSSRR